MALSIDKNQEYTIKEALGWEQTVDFRSLYYPAKSLDPLKNDFYFNHEPALSKVILCKWTKTKKRACLTYRIHNLHIQKSGSSLSGIFSSRTPRS